MNKVEIEWYVQNGTSRMVRPEFITFPKCLFRWELDNTFSIIQSFKSIHVRSSYLKLILRRNDEDVSEHHDFSHV
jgi:hypothetical protein